MFDPVVTQLTEINVLLSGTLVKSPSLPSGKLRVQCHCCLWKPPASLRSSYYCWLLLLLLLRYALFRDLQCWHNSLGTVLFLISYLDLHKKFAWDCSQQGIPIILWQNKNITGFRHSNNAPFKSFSYWCFFVKMFLSCLHSQKGK